MKKLFLFNQLSQPSAVNITSSNHDEDFENDSSFEMFLPVKRTFSQLKNF